MITFDRQLKLCLNPPSNKIYFWVKICMDSIDIRFFNWFDRFLWIIVFNEVPTSIVILTKYFENWRTQKLNFWSDIDKTSQSLYKHILFNVWIILNTTCCELISIGFHKNCCKVSVNRKESTSKYFILSKKTLFLPSFKKFSRRFFNMTLKWDTQIHNSIYMRKSSYPKKLN